MAGPDKQKLYDILGVAKDSDDAVIKKAYRKLAMVRTIILSKTYTGFSRPWTLLAVAPAVGASQPEAGWRVMRTRRRSPWPWRLHVRSPRACNFRIVSFFFVKHKCRDLALKLCPPS